MAEANKATGSGKFGSCCDELKEAMAGEDFEPLISEGSDGVLYLAVGLLDLDDLRAEFTQDLPGKRRGYAVPEFDDHEAVEGPDPGGLGATSRNGGT